MAILVLVTEAMLADQAGTEVGSCHVRFWPLGEIRRDTKFACSILAFGKPVLTMHRSFDLNNRGGLRVWSHSHPEQLGEPAPEHPLAIDGQGLGIHSSETRVIHHGGIDALAILA